MASYMIADGTVISEYGEESSMESYTDESENIEETEVLSENGSIDLAEKNDDESVLMKPKKKTQHFLASESEEVNGDPPLKASEAENTDDEGGNVSDESVLIKPKKKAQHFLQSDSEDDENQATPQLNNSESEVDQRENTPHRNETTNQSLKYQRSFNRSINISQSNIRTNLSVQLELENDDNFENDFLQNKMFNSTGLFEEIPKGIPQIPTEPLIEEEEEMMKSIHEQVTEINSSIIGDSIKSSRCGRSSTRFSLNTGQKSNDIINGTEDSIEIVQESEEEIIISDDEEGGVAARMPLKPIQPSANTLNRQLTLPQMIEKKSVANKFIDTKSPEKKQVSRMEYIKLKDTLEQLNIQKRKVEMAIRTIQLDRLPDKGTALMNQLKHFEEKIETIQDEMASIDTVGDATPPPLTWRGIEAGATDVQPRTFGKQAIQTYNNEKALTMDRLHNLHASLKSCPTPETMADDPEGVKVELMPHQKHALAWLLWREQQKPAGGILADDMGLGKTLTMISLVAAHNQMNGNEEEEVSSDDENVSEEEQRQFKYNGGTLVVCPASLLGQWTNEVADKVKRGTMSVEHYHGPKRETKAKRLARHDMVVTTYAICVSEGDANKPLFRVKWERIILDEAHQIRNHKSKTALAVYRLGAKRRWALTGTPIHNKELDLFSLLKFLRCSPFDDISTFKRWIASKGTGGHQRLHTVLSSLLLRRTKEQLKELNKLTMPEREWQLIEIKMDKDEMDVYQKILLFSKKLFAQYLHQRAEKNADNMSYNFSTNRLNDPSNEYYKMHKKIVAMNNIPEVKQSDILVLLLRLRQICCHPSLITAMLDNVADLGDDGGDAEVSMDLLDQLNKLNIDDNDEEPGKEEIGEGMGLAEATRNLLNPSNPIFDSNRQSTKIREVIKTIQKNILPANDKAIIVSQWTSLLHLMTPHLDAMNLKYCHLDGTVAVKLRGDIVSNFNNGESDVQIMLLSLTAGGVGLNLVGANHLFFLDLHWNPQLEMQAQDRIYRVGQRKKVYIYKFMTVETIEQRIRILQDNKKEMADALLKGAKMKSSSKLSIDDLKMLFGI